MYDASSLLDLVAPDRRLVTIHVQCTCSRVCVVFSSSFLFGQNVFPVLFTGCVSSGWLLEPGLLSIYMPDHSVWVAESYNKLTGHWL